MLHTIFRPSENQKGNLEWAHKWDPTSGQTTSNKSAFYCCQEARPTEPFIAVVFSRGAHSSLKENRLCDRTGKPQFITGTLWRAPEQTPWGSGHRILLSSKKSAGWVMLLREEAEPGTQTPRQIIQFCISLWSNSHQPPAKPQGDAWPVSSVL